jgi:hypothetical protein
LRFIGQIPIYAARVAALVIAVCALPVPAEPAQAKVGPRAAIVFWPGPQPLAKPPALERLAQAPGLDALGFMSAIQGSYTPEQTFLDMSAGARTTTSLYDGEVPTDLRLDDGRISRWDEVLRRAATPPADVVPGLLAATARAAGRRVGYAGPENARNREAVVAADRSGRVEHVELAPARDVGEVAGALWRRTDLMVAKLAPGPPGKGQLRGLLAARRPADLVLVIQDPSHVTRRLVAAGAAGLTGGTTLYSDSTRTEGVVSSTDAAPTVLERLGIDVPAEISGEPIEARGDATPAELSELRNRLTDLGPRRWLVIVFGLLGAVAVGGAWAVARRDRGLPRRTALLAALWLPSVLLVSGALAPTAPVETLIVALACAVLAIATDRIRPWPWALAVPAAVAVLLHVADLALGSELVRRSLLGPNPVLGSRFFGAGNELEIALAAVGLLGLGGALATTSPRVRVWG